MKIKKINCEKLILCSLGGYAKGIPSEGGKRKSKHSTFNLENLFFKYYLMKKNINFIKIYKIRCVNKS